MKLLRAAVAAVWQPSRSSLRMLAWASLVSQIGIIVTGGAVRLTASGLGCPAFPGCTDESLTNTPELGIHGYIEFGNRTLTFVLGAIALLTLVATYRLRPARGSLRRLAWALMLGIPAQAVIGGITVETDLNPWVVMLHFMVSAGLVAVATVLVRRVDEPDGPAHPVGSVWLTRLAVLVFALAFATLYLGTWSTPVTPTHLGRDSTWVPWPSCMPTSSSSSSARRWGSTSPPGPPARRRAPSERLPSCSASSSPRGWWASRSTSTACPSFSSVCTCSVRL